MIGDFLRFWRDQVYWNARKSWFVSRGRRGPAPCQHPSDSGRAGETACIACIGWKKPGRFAHVCPLLERRGDEWRCSVAASAVRPFWGRAVLAWLVGGLVLWTVTTLGAFAVLRGIGYREFRYADFWSLQARGRFRAAQGAFYERDSQAAFARGDFPSGLLSLSIAFERNPRNWQAGLLLGQLLARTRQYPASDRTFRALIESFPEHAEEFSDVWCDALLLRGEAEPVVTLAAERLAVGATNRGAWLRAVVAVLRETPDAGEAESRWTELGRRLPAEFGEVASVESGLRRGEFAAVRTRLNSVVPAESAALALYRCETLLAAGAPELAAVQCNLNEAVLGRFHVSLLRGRIAAAQGNAGLADLAYENLVAGDLVAPKLNLLCAELVRAPSKGRAGILIRAWRAGAARSSRGDVIGALQLAAWLSGAQDELAGDPALGAIPAVIGALPNAVTALDRDHVRWLLHALPLPREVVFALRERTSAPSTIKS